MTAARALRILGTGAVVPDNELLSTAIDERLGLAAGTVEARTGVRVRYVEHGTAAQLGARAARKALAAAGLDLADVDVIIGASATPDQPLPCNAALLHEELAPPHPVPAWDVNASCLSFLVALDLAATLIDAGRHRHVLVVSSDIASVGLDWSELGASGIFGDGAAAAVLGPADGTDSAVLAAGFSTHSEGAHTCEIPGGGSRHAPDRVEGPYGDIARFRMDGGAVFRLAIQHLPPFVDGLLAEAGDIELPDLPLVIPHQASHHGLSWLRQRLGLRDDQMVDIYADRGNQVAASLPSALHAAIESGRLRRGDLALLLGTGAGLSIGGIVLCY
ncbi:3-oxoacyl-[acyl-carrier-protein] synthase III C-terminal domain-containing protein [Nocardioides panacisoli]|uniref:3-oxoacyl-[acyl-carrier-protein] synthase III C-terminal domain-containing protein n=1 Tax=Nocardioides panacisoli TaxID=627624 RepID=A0ABP7IAY6_9ACTN